jgi:UDP-2,3-diacylglucosamine pyrophosphatase LpxH
VRIRIITDTHLANKYGQVDCTLPNTYEECVDNNIFLLGDIFDLARCEPDVLRKLKQRTQLMHDVIAKGRYCHGNHDHLSNGLQDIWISKGILGTHGDLAVDAAKWQDYRNKPQGRGTSWMQWVISKHYGHLSKGEAKLLADYAKARGAHTVCTGHVHVKKLFDENINGVRVLCFPQGTTDIEV